MPRTRAAVQLCAQLIYHYVSLRTRGIHLLNTRREDQINIKGKTGESVDAIGEERAIGCHCVVLIEK